MIRSYKFSNNLFDLHYHFIGVLGCINVCLSLADWSCMFDVLCVFCLFHTKMLETMSV